MGSEGAAIVPKRRTQPRKMSEANNDAKTSFEKRLVFVWFLLIRSFGVLLLKFGVAFVVFLPVFGRM